MEVKMEPLDRNGNLLRGAAKQAYLKKQWQIQNLELTISRELELTSLKDLDLTILSLNDRIERLERRTKNLPVMVIAALVFGCFTGKLINPDLIVIAIGGGAAGVGMAVMIARQ
jgi:hypothetical protein